MQELSSKECQKEKHVSMGFTCGWHFQNVEQQLFPLLRFQALSLLMVARCSHKTQLPSALLPGNHLMLPLRLVSMQLIVQHRKRCLVCSAWARNRCQSWPPVMFPEETRLTLTTQQGKERPQLSINDTGNPEAESPFNLPISALGFSHHHRGHFS